MVRVIVRVGVTASCSLPVSDQGWINTSTQCTCNVFHLVAL